MAPSLHFDFYNSSGQANQILMYAHFIMGKGAFFTPFI